MKTTLIIFLATTVLLWEQCLATSNASNHYQTLAAMQGDWILAPASTQEGGATKKGPAAKMIGTNQVAMSFKLIGKGSTVQENLLPGTVKEMATMYHCDNFNNCQQVKATHYCAKQNQPALVLDSNNSSKQKITMDCDMNSPLCNSAEGHVHKITHELSNGNRKLKTTYTIFKDGKFQKNSIYHFVRK
ncbi:MAG: hypothetical protein ACWA5Q_08200 [bacterium]